MSPCIDIGGGLPQPEVRLPEGQLHWSQLPRHSH